ncbi:RNA-binding S4 domain-containing protein [Mucilaginibacter roseus]|uniref:RNA-binding S4 domain-containing protein n=1 Tax=Mucilaginibacter roseus TaxID=1528868 RepID=A0ABS8U7W8_9SPHI|nr:RNA-binding S4 domain-containing protein [Mucilaginibacter roseus]MCD8741713.1 RNA-binding S4 domain-containing protein [Mucilaginibacter roseus]
MPEKEKLRIDKYLWAIRLFKTRTLAAEACKAGRVKKDGQNLKASYEVKLGDTYNVSKGLERKVVKVTGLLENRVDAKKAVDFYEDLTPVQDTHSFQSMFHAPTLRRDRGTGRPTKRDRREIDDLQEGFFENSKDKEGEEE